MKVLLCLAIVAQICSSLKQVGRSGSAKHSSKKQNVQVSTETDADSLLISHEKVSESANFIMKNTKLKPKIGIICGSGLAGLSDLLEISDTLAYKDIPNFPASTIEGHLPNLVIGTVQDTAVIMMLGKFFILEGHSPAISAMPVRVMKLIGVEILIVTNSAGGINRSFKVGDIMVIKDHINLPGFSGVNPLRGPNDDGFGERFFAMNNGYDRRWRKLAKAISKKMKNKLKIHEGVYVMITGPNYETVAELKMMQMFGADAVDGHLNDRQLCNFSTIG